MAVRHRREPREATVLGTDNGGRREALPEE
jgi:hypothetical protein